VSSLKKQPSIEAIDSIYNGSETDGDSQVETNKKSIHNELDRFPLDLDVFKEDWPSLELAESGVSGR
jgi:hypothetical protein